MVPESARPARGWFIAGTDTAVGKTYVAASLCRALATNGRRVAAMKPVATGSATSGEALRNADALELQSACTVTVPYEWLNPYCFAPAISPHLAARDAGTRIDPLKIRTCYDAIAGRADAVVVEGAGGWLTPIDDERTMADVVASLALPVILVIGLRLGCLNHAALTVQAIRTTHVLAGWVANAIDPSFERAAGNLASLERICGGPALALLPHRKAAAGGSDWTPAAVSKLLS